MRLLPTLIRTLGTFLSCCVVAAGFVYVGHAIREAALHEAKGQVEAAKYNELAARHEALEALYGSVRWQAVVESANQKLFAACEQLPKKKRKGICPVGS